MTVSESSAECGLDIAVFGENARWRREESGVSQGVASIMPSHVREVEAIGGRAFEVTHELGKDILMLRNSRSTRVETERLGSDFEWVWARFENRPQATPVELVLIGGHTLQLEGREILKSTKRIQFLVTTQIGEQLEVETEAGVLDLSLPIHDLESLFAKLMEQSQI